MRPRTHRSQALLLVAVALALLGCNEHPTAYSLQARELRGSPAERRPYLGRWCDSDGNVGLSVSNSPSPRLEARLPDFVRLTEGRLANGELVLSLTSGEQSVELTVVRLEPDLVAIRPRGSQSAGSTVCGSCSPWLRRGFGACGGTRASRRLVQLAQGVPRAIEDYLVDHL